MWPYWLMYSIPALAASLAGRSERNLSSMPWLLLGLFFTICIGFRFQVGGDWNNYLPYYYREIGASFSDPINSDLGYVLLNRLMAHLNWGIYGVNATCGLLFISGLIAFCRAQQRSWLAFASAVPYIVIVVAMGYIRQSVALGFIFFALAFIEREKFLQYVFFISIASMFHNTAIIMIPFGIFVYRKGFMLRVLSLSFIGYALWDAFMVYEAEKLWIAYVEQKMFSQGANIRVTMNLIAAVCLLINWKQWKKIYPNALLWLWMAFAAVACTVAVSFAPTAVDRIGLYLTPLQITVFARLPYLARRRLSPAATVQWILIGYGAVLFVWLNYAVHARYWIPYRNVLFE